MERACISCGPQPNSQKPHRCQVACSQKRTLKLSLRVACTRIITREAVETRAPHIDAQNPLQDMHLPGDVILKAHRCPRRRKRDREREREREREGGGRGRERESVLRVDEM